MVKILCYYATVGLKRIIVSIVLGSSAFIEKLMYVLKIGMALSLDLFDLLKLFSQLLLCFIGINQIIISKCGFGTLKWLSWRLVLNLCLLGHTNQSSQKAHKFVT